MMGYRRIKAQAITRVEYSFGKYTLLTKSEGSDKLDKTVFQYYDPRLGDVVQVEMTRDDLGDLMVLLNKMKDNGEIHMPTDYVTN